MLWSTLIPHPSQNSDLGQSNAKELYRAVTYSLAVNVQFVDYMDPISVKVLKSDGKPSPLKTKKDTSEKN